MKEEAALRSRIMRAVKAKNTAPEICVRRLVHALGYRFRLHRSDLPGKPDIVLPRHRKVIFVHGCFWHGHDCSRGGRKPKTNTSYWQNKVARNVERHRTVESKLIEHGWRVLVVWECNLKDIDQVRECLQEFLTT